MRVKASSFTLNKKGVVNFHTGTANNCGFTGVRKFNYVLRVKVPVSLDANGYTVEHNTIAASIQRDAVPGSCEQVAISIVKATLLFWEDNGLPYGQPLSIYAKVWPELKGQGTAFIEYQEDYE